MDHTHPPKPHPSTPPPFQTTFKLGLSYLPLAHSGLDALEAWSEQLPPELLRPHLKAVLPYLDDYLRVMGTSSGGDKPDKEATVGKTLSISAFSAGRRKVPSDIVERWRERLQGAQSPLSLLRQRIVFFLGSLGGEVNSALVETGTAAAHAAKMVAWDSKKRLEFSLPFQDMKPSLFLGEDNRWAGLRRYC